MPAAKPSPLPRDPWVASLIPNPAQVPALRRLSGYIGDSTTPGYVRLYLDASLSRWIEIAETQIAYHQPRPQSLWPLGGVFLWVLIEEVGVATGMSTMAGGGGGPVATTLMVGEEDVMVTTLMVGEESNLPGAPVYTTLMVGEESNLPGAPVYTTLMVGEETNMPSPTSMGAVGPTTKMVGEEANLPGPGVPTTLAVGEETMYTTLAIGEESGGLGGSTPFGEF